MLTRRAFTGAAAAACAGAPFVAAAQAAVTLKFATFQGPTSFTWNQMLKPWMEAVERDSGRRIRFEGYPAMQLGGTAAQLYDQARDGVADIVWTLPGYSAGRFPRLEVFELPFMMNNAEATSKAVWEYVQAQAADEFKETRLLAMHVHGPGVLHTQKPVTTAADLKGMKVRGPTRQVTRLLGVLGATPVGMLLPQIPDALSKGTIDGCVLNWEVVPAVKVQELTKFHGEFATTGPALYTTSFMMTMNRARYDGLPSELRQVIDANSGLATSAFLGRTVQSGDAPGRKLAQDRGNQIHTFNAAETQAFQQQSARVVDEWVQEVAKRNIDGNALIKTARELIAKHARTT